MTGRLDIDAIRASADLVEIAGRYLELRRAGTEYEALCPFHGDGNPSFTIYRGRDGVQRFMCFACGEKGDAVDFVAKIENVAIGEAARRIGGAEFTPPADRPKPPPPPPAWVAVVPVPDDAPAMDPAHLWNVKRGRESTLRPVRTDAYRDKAGRLLGYVLRAELRDGQKWTPTVTWAHPPGEPDAARWALVPFPEPRPLQGLDELARRPQAPVLVVSGEKCREEGQGVLPGFVVVTWPGGDNGVGKCTWAALAGRTCTFWPDADASGAAAMEAAAAAVLRISYGMPQQPVLRMLDPADLVAEFGKGADVADLVAAGWNTARIIAWAKARVRPWEGTAAGPADAGGQPGEAPGAGPAASVNHATSDAPSAMPAQPPAPAEPDPEPEPRAVAGEVVDLPNEPTSAAYDALTTWSALGLALSDKGVPAANMDNAARLLERHPDVVGRFWFDEFLQRILTSWTADGTAREWTDADDVRLCLWMQRKLGIGRMAVGTVRDAVTAVAMAHVRNEVREWLDALDWDQQPRLAGFLAAAFGAEQNDYTAAVGRCFIMGLVARALGPGCKVDNMPVFEGPQGLRKSTALRVLVGDRWFAEANKAPTEKDFFVELIGKLLVEIGEMDAFNRSEKETIKRMLSCLSDRYRPPYGRRAQDFPRQGAFAGTTNHDDWNRDETGARRFWPVACTRVDLAWIVAHRAQLFAEAVARYRAGEPWWDVPDEDAKREQEARRATDAWEPVIADWLLAASPEVTVGDVLAGALKLEVSRWDKPAEMRVARCLRALGYVRGQAWRRGRNIKVWSKRDEGGYGGTADLL